jgi:branched-chain amino acid transport system substrate-binding protein
MKKYLLNLVTLLFLSAPAYADITIGLAGPLTGPVAELGEQMRLGAEQAVADINASGGVNGEKLVLHESDDACDPKQAVVIANQMVNTGIKFVVGHACSGTSIPASKIYNEENILMITPTSTNPVLTEAGLKNVFRTCGRDDEEGAVQAQYVLKHFPGKKVAIIHDNSAVGLDLAEQFRKNLNKGGAKEIFFDSYVPGEKDYSTLITKLKQMGAQVLVIGGYPVETSLIARQIRQQGAQIQVIGDDALATPEFWTIAGANGEGVLFTYQPDPRKLPGTKKMTEEMRKAGHEPEGYEFYAYAAVQVIVEGIKRAGNDPAKAAVALRQTPVPTVLGTIGFDAKGDVKGSNYVLYSWHDGKYAQVED